MEEIDLDKSAVRLVQQIKHYLITNMGKTLDEASDEEIYRAMSWTFREEIMLNWTATKHTHAKKKCRMVYYLSLEWLPGRFTVNNIVNFTNIDLVQKTMKLIKRDFPSIIATEAEPGLGNGGLGRLAACYLDSLATLNYPAMGYGLRYQYGIFEQEIWAGVQLERPDCWLLTENPWEMKRDLHAVSVHYGGNIVHKMNKHEEEAHHIIDHDEVRALPYDIPIVGYGNMGDFSVLTLRVFTTKENPRNFGIVSFNTGDLATAVSNTSITDLLYPNDKYSLGFMMRIKQEFLLVSGSLQDIIRNHMGVHGNIESIADKVRIQINDTHPAFTISEMMRLLTAEHELPWKKAWEYTQQICSYTNHTVLKESLEEWDCHHIKELLPRQYKIVEKINQNFCDSVRKKYPNDEEKIRKMSIIEDGKMRMANLAIVGSHKVNGVARLHSEIIKNNIFPEFNDFFPGKFTNVTNGVTFRRWLHKCNPNLTHLLHDLIGEEWVKDFNRLEKLKEHADDAGVQDAFLEIKRKNKLRLIDALARYKKMRYGDTVDLSEELFLEGDAIFDVQVKRVHEYKRQLLNLLHAIILYQQQLKNPGSRARRKIIIAGKAAPGYDMAKNFIRLAYMLGRKINTDPKVGNHLKVLFIENYNVSKAETIIPAADLSEQISTAGYEASGTGNMKLSINGALTIGTEDGANIEMHEAVGDEFWPFSFGHSSDEIRQMQKDKSYDPNQVLKEHPYIKEAMDLLIDGSLCENDVEGETLRAIHDNLLVGNNADFFFVLKDLHSYAETQKKVEDLYKQPREWARYALHNIASMGKFSSDNSIQHYANEIWGLEPCPIDQEELSRVRKEFNEADRCYIAS